MYNYHEMEKRYDEYRKQTTLRWIYPVSGVSMALLAGSMFFALTAVNDAKVEANKSKEQNATPAVQVQQVQRESNETDKNISTPVHPSADTVVATPRQVAKPTITETVIVPKAQPKPTIKETVIVPTAQSKAPPANMATQFAKPGVVTIQVNNSDIIPMLEERFATKPDNSTAIKLANAYFHKRDYQSAANWAMKANDIDAKNEESWIIFARSLNRLGKKSDAIKALDGYLRQNDSANVREWQAKIKNGSPQ